MKQKWISLALALMLLLALSAPALADTYTGEQNWKVTYGPSEEEPEKVSFVSNFNSGDIDDVIYNMQPGDSVRFTIDLINDSEDRTLWYMRNEVLTSLEETQNSASGGAYTYRLTFVDNDGVRYDLFSSDDVGGEKNQIAGPGLHEATLSTEDWFYLAALDGGQKGAVMLTVSLDGETQGNGYQDTFAHLKMNFAVELEDGDVPLGPPPGTPPGPQTGEDISTMPYILVGFIGGVGLLIFGFVSLNKLKKKEQEQGGAEA